MGIFEAFICIILFFGISNVNSQGYGRPFYGGGGGENENYRPTSTRYGNSRPNRYYENYGGSNFNPERNLQPEFGGFTQTGNNNFRPETNSFNEQPQAGNNFHSISGNNFHSESANFGENNFQPTVHEPISSNHFKTQPEFVNSKQTDNIDTTGIRTFGKQNTGEVEAQPTADIASQKNTKTEQQPQNNPAEQPQSETQQPEQQSAKQTEKPEQQFNEDSEQTKEIPKIEQLPQFEPQLQPQIEQQAQENRPKDSSLLLPRTTTIDPNNEKFIPDPPMS